MDTSEIRPSYNPEASFNQAVGVYLATPDFKRQVTSLPEINFEQRRILARKVIDLYRQAKQEPDKGKKTKLMGQFYDCLALILCDPKERKMASCPSTEVLDTVLVSSGHSLGFGTGTSGERVYFETAESSDAKDSSRWMIYPIPTDSATELGRKYYRRFCETFGRNRIDLDQTIILEDLD